MGTQIIIYIVWEGLVSYTLNILLHFGVKAEFHPTVVLGFK